MGQSFGHQAYPQTAQWGVALHASRMAPAGLCWMSRHDNRARAFVLFGDRVAPDDLEPVDPGLVPLWEGPGLEFVDDLATRAGVDVIR